MTFPVFFKKKVEKIEVFFKKKHTFRSYCKQLDKKNDIFSENTLLAIGYYMKTKPSEKVCIYLIKLKTNFSKILRPKNPLYLE